MSNILVLGATGNNGSEVVAALKKRNVPCKAAVRTKEKGSKIEGPGVELVEVDLDNVASLTAALQGIQKLFVVTPPVSTHLGRSIFDEAKKAGVKHVVLLTAACDDHPKFIWGQYHYENEKYLAATGMDYTILRPTSFFVNLFGHLDSIKNESAIYQALGYSKMNFISNSDIGEAAAVVLTTEGHAGKTYTLTGPDTITWFEVADIFSELLDREISYIPITDEQLRAKMAKWMSGQALDGYSNMLEQFRGGLLEIDTPDLEKLLGRKGVGLRDWLPHVIGAFK